MEVSVEQLGARRPPKQDSSAWMLQGADREVRVTGKAKDKDGEAAEGDRGGRPQASLFHYHVSSHQNSFGTSLVVQWLRLRLLMQEVLVQSLVG